MQYTQSRKRVYRYIQSSGTCKNCSKVQSNLRSLETTENGAQYHPKPTQSSTNTTRSSCEAVNQMFITETISWVCFLPIVIRSSLDTIFAKLYSNHYMELEEINYLFSIFEWMNEGSGFLQEFSQFHVRVQYPVEIKVNNSPRMKICLQEF